MRGFAATHPGHHRAVNEDLARWDPSLGLAIVLDGTGGGDAGPRATVIIHDAIVAAVLAYRDLDDALRAANDALIREVVRDPTLRGAGATAVAMRIEGSVATIAHAGDARAYRRRASALEALTRDHDLVRWAVDHGQDPALLSPEHREVITSAIHAGELVHVDMRDLAIAPGDRLILTTDGVHDFLDEDALAIDDPEAAACAAIERAIARGSRDNLSIAIVDV